MSFLALMVYATYTGGMLLAEKINHKPFVANPKLNEKEIQEQNEIAMQIRKEENKAQYEMNQSAKRVERMAEKQARMEVLRKNHGYPNKEMWRKGRLLELGLNPDNYNLKGD